MSSQMILCSAITQIADQSASKPTAKLNEKSKKIQKKKKLSKDERKILKASKQKAEKQ